MSGAPNVWAPNVPDRQISGRQMSGAGNVPTAYCLGHLLSREPNFRAPNVPTPIVGRGSAGAKCTTTDVITTLYYDVIVTNTDRIWPTPLRPSLKYPPLLAKKAYYFRFGENT